MMARLPAASPFVNASRQATSCKENPYIPPFVVFLWFSTVVDWFAAKWIYASQSPRKRKLLIILSLVTNLGLIGYFKYGIFLLDNFLLLMHSVGVDISPAKPNIILPVGISFYTFQTLSYTLDVYRKNLVPPKSFLDYALFVTFFPQLVAGPIIRAVDFLPLCDQPKRFSGKALGWGLSLMLLGLFEKIAIALALLRADASRSIPPGRLHGPGHRGPS